MAAMKVIDRYQDLNNTKIVLLHIVRMYTPHVQDNQIERLDRKWSWHISLNYHNISMIIVCKIEWDSEHTSKGKHEFVYVRF
jgi:hypothetical protein